MSQVITPHAQHQPRGPVPDLAAFRALAHDALCAAPVLDMHTHLFAPQFGALNLWGIDELLTYHYLIAEYFRYSSTAEEDFWKLSKQQQADAIWKTLFVENTPISEATCGVVNVLTEYALDPRAKNLKEARAFFAAQNPDEHLNGVLRRAGIEQIVMTNDPFDADEAALWDTSEPLDPRFKAVVRLDCMLNSWPTAVGILRQRGHHVDATLDDASIAELRRFLARWIARMRPVYMAVSLPDSFSYPEASARNTLLEEVVLPACHEHGLPLALMIGVRRQINPRLRMAGDGVGRADIQALEHLCARFPDNRFLVTMLSRENQYELCVAARKFRNLMPFGCWWFLNNPSLITEMTRMRLEMLGTSFIPQHSDARILEQVIYKWKHSRRCIADALAESYYQLALAGRVASKEEIERDARLLLGGNFSQWIAPA